jgi:RNA 2',3'-cyclic 3'-phosphodiesterase
MKRSRKHPKKDRPSPPNALTDAQRLFIALPVPDEVKHLIASVIDRLDSLDDQMRWVNPDSAHLTLHFLGPTPPEQTEILKMALTKPAMAQSPFRLETSALGVFPNIQKASVLWLGIDGETDAFRSMHRLLGGRLAEFDVEIESRPPIPHITIGRVRDKASSAFLRRFAAELQSDDLKESVSNMQSLFEVDRFELIQSHLEKTGPRYETRATFPLNL